MRIWLVIVLGSVMFATIMGVREAVTGTWLRALVAACGGLVFGLVIRAVLQRKTNKP